MLSGNADIIFQYPVNDAGERLRLGPQWRVLPTVPRRNQENRHIAYRFPLQPEHLGSLPGAHPFHSHRSPDPQDTYPWNIHPTNHWFNFEPLDSGRRPGIQTPQVSDLFSFLVQLDSAEAAGRGRPLPD